MPMTEALGLMPRKLEFFITTPLCTIKFHREPFLKIGFIVCVDYPGEIPGRDIGQTKRNFLLSDAGLTR
jgi:hypothetical protein